MHYYQQATIDLQRAFGRLAPHELVSSGRCSLNDWLRVLEARREQFEVAYSNQAQDVKRASVFSQVRLKILGAMLSSSCFTGLCRWSPGSELKLPGVTRSS